MSKSMKPDTWKGVKSGCYTQGLMLLHFTKKKGAGQIMTKIKRTSATPEQFVLRRRIGSTNYRVRVCFNPNSKERLEEKVRRLLKNDLQATAENGSIKSLQASWLPERSSL